MLGCCRVRLDMAQCDCMSTGEPWREFKTDALKILAGKVDDSGTSLADHQLGVDMGGPNPGAVAMPPGNTRDGTNEYCLPHRSKDD